LDYIYKPQFVEVIEGKEKPDTRIKQLKPYPLLNENFSRWLVKYSNFAERKRKELKFQNRLVYDIENKNNYHQAIIDFIAAMTDNFALRVFSELTRFG
jgi:dGTPase